MYVVTHKDKTGISMERALRDDEICGVFSRSRSSHRGRVS